MKFPDWSEKRMRELADAEPGGLMACSPEILAELKIMAGTDPAIAATLELAGIKPEHVEKVVVHVSRGWREAVAKGLGLRDGEPCSHPGCLSHVSHPCEGCGRVGGRTVLCDEILQCCGKCGKIPEAHYKDKHGDLWCVGNVNEAYEPVPIEYPGEGKN
jgi:hypothetical protein